METPVLLIVPVLAIAGILIATFSDCGEGEDTGRGARRGADR
jgi:hypothetical protein